MGVKAIKEGAVGFLPNPSGAYALSFVIVRALERNDNDLQKQEKKRAYGINRAVSSQKKDVFS